MILKLSREFALIREKSVCIESMPLMMGNLVHGTFLIEFESQMLAISISCEFEQKLLWNSNGSFAFILH